MMKKLLDLLEQQVQWIAIGIAVLYLAFTIWTYVVKNPITQDLQSGPVDLGSVDQTILENAANPLKQKMESTEAVPELQKKPEFSGNFEQKVIRQPGEAPPPTLTGYWLEAPPAPGGDISPDMPTGRGPVAELPVPPTPDLVGIKAYRDQVSTSNSNNPAPVMVEGGQPGAPQQPGVEDKNWVTVEGKISIGELSKRLTEAKYPTADQTTEFLRVDVQRQEQLPDGSWGNETTVQPPIYLGIPAYPADNNPAQQLQYAGWAKSNVVLILQPPTFNVVQGKPWYLPSDAATEEAISTPNAPAFDPTNLKMVPHTPDEKKARLDYLNSQQYKDLLRQRNNTPAGPQPGQQFAPPGGAGFGPGGPQGMAPRDVTDSAVLAQARFGGPQPFGQPGMPPGAMGGPFAPPGGEGNPNAAPMMQQNLQGSAAAAVQKFASALPQAGEFDPSKQQDVECWAHDDSVQPGKAYRYRFRYMVLNPAHGKPMVAGNQHVLQALALTSDYSRWSDPVAVPPIVSFFVASGISAGERVNFKIFKWQNGQFSTVTEQDSAGDVIGAAHANANNVNYTTKWTMVAIRTDYDNESYVLLVGPEGQLVRRDYQHDQLDPQYRDLIRQMTPPTQPGAPAAAPTPQPMPFQGAAGGGRF